MLKQLLIVSVLLISSVNADIFKELKVAAEQLKQAQNVIVKSDEVNTNSNNVSIVEVSPEVSTNNKVSPVEATTLVPQFNSLAEEMAYEKEQVRLEEQQRIAKEKEYELKEKDRKDRYEAKEKAILEKYFIKRTDSLEVIESKFKNRVRLFSEMPEDYNELGKLSQYGSKFVHMPEKTYFSSLTGGFTDLDSCQDDNYKDCMQEKFESYEQYIKKAYETYETRQADLAREKEIEIKQAQQQKEWELKQAQTAKEQQIRIANEQKERQKVQGACQIWRAKANRMVYSLGVGDRVVSKNGGVYIIQGTNANTFLVNVLGVNLYLQKSECIPYQALRNAPSPYCYK